jgi:hypothetical protein
VAGSAVYKNNATENVKQLCSMIGA